MAHKKTLNDSESMLVKGTFQQVLDVAENNGTAIFNVLDISMGDSLSVDVPPSFLNIASEEHALQPTKKMIGDTDFRNDLIWATVSNTHAFSSAHVDDEGFATATNTLVGGKLWAIETHKSPAKNMTSIHAFDHCQPGNFDTKQVCYEIMYLPPRCVL